MYYSKGINHKDIQNTSKTMSGRENCSHFNERFYTAIYFLGFQGHLGDKIKNVTHVTSYRLRSDQSTRVKDLLLMQKHFAS